MNKVTLFGRLGNDAELKHTQGGHALLKLRLATTEQVKKGEEWVSETDWHNIVLWGKRAEGLAKHLKKGGQVLVEGRLKTSEYTDSQGDKRYSTEVVAEDIEFGGDPKPRQEDAGSSNNTRRQGGR